MQGIEVNQNMNSFLESWLLLFFLLLMLVSVWTERPLKDKTRHKLNIHCEIWNVSCISKYTNTFFAAVENTQTVVVQSLIMLPYVSWIYIKGTILKPKNIQLLLQIIFIVIFLIISLPFYEYRAPRLLKKENTR